MPNPFSDIIEKVLGSRVAVAINVTRADANGTAWNVDSDHGTARVDMPFGSDDYDVSAKVRAACNDAHLYANISHPEDGRVDAYIVRD